MRRSLLALVALALVLALPLPASAAPGDVDTSFDNNGMLTVGFGSGAEGMEVLNDGTILLGGTYGGDLGFVSLGSGGSPTPGFGTDGVAMIDLGGPDRGQGLAVDTDGSLVVAGWNSSGGNDDTAIGKVDDTGTPVAGFSGDGARAFDFGKGKDDRAYDVDLTSSGKIVVGGSVTVAGKKRFILARIRKDGEKDTSFGGGDGVVKLKLGSKSEIRDVLVLPNDSILVAGYAQVGGGHGNDFAIARFRANGTLDGGFSGDGKLLVGSTEGEIAETVALLPDGRFAVAGSFGRDMIVRWFTGSGVASESMGVNGYTRIAYGTSPARAYDFLPGSNGRFYVVGTGATPTDVLVVRLNNQGVADGAFGSSGRATADFFGAESGAAAALTPGGRLLVAGQTDGFDADHGRAVSGSMLVVRFLP
jgi:uncharacterized delta-60 repeat protein